MKFSLQGLANALAGRTGDLPRNPVPIELMGRAEPPNLPDARAIGLNYSPAFQADLEQSLRDESDALYCQKDGGEPAYCTLALSGGAGFGAFGAGFLNGWTAAGTRPNFKAITGISAGALIAPLAFVGQEYDQALREIFTGVDDDSIFSSKGLLAVLNDESFKDSTPLSELVARYIDDDFLKKVAREHDAGRRLMLGTTNMDRQRFVVWNMGLIARSGNPDALDLFRKVMMASSSIPGLFQPIYVDVEVDGAKYDEMHGDGSVFTPVFFHTSIVDPIRAIETVNAEDGRSRPLRGRLYVIRHGEVDPVPQHVERRIMPIIRRAIATSVKSMTLKSLYFMYIEAQAANTEFNYVGIPEDFVPTSEKDFDIEDMNRLFRMGEEMAKAGYHWRHVPPEFEQSPLSKKDLPGA